MDDGICEGVRGLVAWLNQRGFNTTDSGDGSHFSNGMEGALPEPMVAIVTRHENLLLESIRLRAALDFAGADQSRARIQATYSPYDDVPVIVLTGISDADIPDLDAQPATG